VNKLAKITAALAAVFSLQAHAVLIDGFDDAQALISTSGPATSNFISTLGGMLGGERDVFIEQFTAQAVNAQVTGSRFIYGQSGNGLGRGTLQWDGIDGSSALDTNGLGGASLTAGGAVGFKYTVFSDGGNPVTPAALITTTVYAADGVKFATLSFDAVPTGGDFTETIAFTDSDWIFNGGFTLADFGSVGAIQIVLNVNGNNASLDVELDTLETTLPEPGSLALAGLAMLGAAGIRRRRK
jgi:hypothetical protein